MAFRLVVEYKGSELVNIPDCTDAEYTSGELQWQSESNGPGSEFLSSYVYQNNVELKGGEIWDGSDGDVFLSVYDEEQNFGGTDPGTNPGTNPEIPEGTPTGEVYLYSHTVLTNGSAVNDVSVTLINKSSEATLVEEDGHYTFTYPLNSGNIPLPDIEITSEKYEVDGWVHFTWPTSSEICTYIDSNSDLGSYNEFSIRLKLKDFSLSPSDLTLSVGETGVITVTPSSSQNITWGVYDTTIITVERVGNSATVTAVSEGTTTITASNGTKTASCTVTVSAPTISEYTLNIYDESIEEIMKTITIPKGEKINAYIYENKVYNEINDKDAHKDGYYISEWINCVTDDIISDDQIMERDLDIYPGYTEIKTEYYSAVRLPDLAQRFPFGTGGSYILGGTGGEETVTLKSKQCALPRHTHRVLVDTDSDAPTHPKPYLPNGSIPGVEAHPLNQTSGGERDYTQDADNSYKTPVVYYAEQLSAEKPHNNMPPYLVVNFIIKYK